MSVKIDPNRGMWVRVYSFVDDECEYEFYSKDQIKSWIEEGLTDMHISLQMGAICSQSLVDGLAHYREQHETIKI